MFRVDAIVTEHFEMFFRDVNNEPLNKVKGRNGLGNGFIIFVTSVMKGYIFAIVIINTGSGNNGSSKIPADIFNRDIRSAKIRLCTDIESVSMSGVHFVFNFAERRTNARCKLFEQNLAKSLAEKVVVKVFHGTPGGDVTSTTLRNEGVDMRIPLQIAPKSVKDANKPGGKVFSFVDFGKHTKNNIANRMKQTIEKGPVL